MKTKSIIMALAIALGAVGILSLCGPSADLKLKTGSRVSVYSVNNQPGTFDGILFGDVVSVNGKWLLLKNATSSATRPWMPRGTVLVNLDLVKWVELEPLKE